MEQRFPRFVLAAPGSGSGKTVAVCGILQALLSMGKRPAAFKCGPDYIDPMFHQYVLGIVGCNLDTFFLEREECLSLYKRMACRGDISVIEGVMGYYDGIGGDTVHASTYEVAKTIQAPVILVLNAKGASLSVAAMAKGFLEYRKDSGIQGVICNRMSGMLYEKIKPEIEKLGVKALGYIPENPACRLESRHLGLTLPGEVADMRKRVEEIGSLLLKTLDMEGILELADSAPSLSYSPCRGRVKKTEENMVKIGVAKDEAFCFYYQENLEVLKNMGVQIRFFSPLLDQRLPEDVCGLLFGGGYPENYGKELSGNRFMLSSIRMAAGKGMPVIAECGGFLYLHEELEGTDGKRYPMVGLLKGRAFREKKLSRFGYISLKPKIASKFLGEGEEIKAHEFHYWESENPGNCFTAIKPGGGRTWECLVEQDTLFCGFPHLYYPSNPKVAQHFIMLCMEFKKRQKEGEL